VLSPEETAAALAILADRFVEPPFLDREGCRACPSGKCRCEWRSDVWLEIVSPPVSAAEPKDFAGTRSRDSLMNPLTQRFGVAGSILAVQRSRLGRAMAGWYGAVAPHTRSG